MQKQKKKKSKNHKNVAVYIVFFVISYPKFLQKQIY